LIIPIKRNTLSDAGMSMEYIIFEATLVGAEVLVEHIPNALRYQTTGFSIPICIILVHMDTLFDVGIGCNACVMDGPLLAWTKVKTT
jgi:hypothetical protein